MSNETPVVPQQYDPLKHRELHIEMLKERVFQLNRWPHYQLLLDDLQELSSVREYDDYQRKIGKLAGLPTEGLKILSLERTLLYGGKSMFAPIFYDHDYRIREASPESAYERGPYNAHMVGPAFMEYGKPYSGVVKKNDFDLIIIPNALHHIPLTGGDMPHPRPGGYLYIYEQFIEEIHQAPDDYVRYTPDGLSSLLQAAGYQIEWVRTTGNIYTCAKFLIEQMLEYIDATQPKDPRESLGYGMSKGEDIRKIQKMLKTLDGFAKEYPTTNRKYTQCPKAFSVLARKPV